ncbi:MAG: hypothetical protein II771_04040 [Clostridia bacterium]|nr:hypothetical protein [Clostridia bacterium]
MKRFACFLAALLLAALLLSACQSASPAPDGKETAPDGKPLGERVDPETAATRLPDTTLEFWICEDVEHFDFSAYTPRFGIIGGKEYYGTGYAPTPEGGDPGRCVVYTVTRWPDYADPGAFVTGITVTDPAVRIAGITAASSPDEFRAAMEGAGLTVADGEALSDLIDFSLTAKAESYSVFFSRVRGEESGTIRIVAPVENREGIVY